MPLRPEQSAVAIRALITIAHKESDILKEKTYIRSNSCSIRFSLVLIKSAITNKTKNNDNLATFVNVGQFENEHNRWNIIRNTNCIIYLLTTNKWTSTNRVTFTAFLAMRMQTRHTSIAMRLAQQTDGNGRHVEHVENSCGWLGWDGSRVAYEHLLTCAIVAELSADFSKFTITTTCENLLYSHC